jgi:hypothetical protein
MVLVQFLEKKLNLVFYVTLLLKKPCVLHGVSEVALQI